MREAHARNPQLRHSAAGQKKKCGHCGQEGHNRRACPQLLAAAQAAGEAVRAAEHATKAGKTGKAAQPAGAAEAVPAGGAAAQAPPQPPPPPGPSRMIVIEEVDAGPLPPEAPVAPAARAAAAAHPDAGQAGSNGGGPPPSSQEGLPRAPAGSGSPAPPTRALPTVAMAPGMSLCPEGSWVFSLPQSKEECVAQAAQVRAGPGHAPAGLRGIGACSRPTAACNGMPVLTWCRSLPGAHSSMSAAPPCRPRCVPGMTAFGARPLSCCCRRRTPPRMVAGQAASASNSGAGAGATVRRGSTQRVRRPAWHSFGAPLEHA